MGLWCDVDSSVVWHTLVESQSLWRLLLVLILQLLSFLGVDSVERVSTWIEKKLVSLHSWQQICKSTINSGLLRSSQLLAFLSNELGHLLLAEIRHQNLEGNIRFQRGRRRVGLDIAGGIIRVTQRCLKWVGEKDEVVITSTKDWSKNVSRTIRETFGEDLSLRLKVDMWSNLLVWKVEVLSAKNDKRNLTSASLSVLLKFVNTVEQSSGTASLENDLSGGNKEGGLRKDIRIHSLVGCGTDNSATDQIKHFLPFSLSDSSQTKRKIFVVGKSDFKTFLWSFESSDFLWWVSGVQEGARHIVKIIKEGVFV
jgi:hypothetical protein